MEYVKGVTFGDLINRDNSKTDYYLELSAEIHAEMHTKTVDSLEKMKDKLTRQLNSAKDLDDLCREKLVKRLNELPMENKLCHGDYHVFNLLMSENGTVVIDWVDASAGSPFADVYRTYLLYSQFNTDWAEKYLSIYCRKTGFSNDDIFLWAPIVAGARLSENVSSENTKRLIDIVYKYL